MNLGTFSTKILESFFFFFTSNLKKKKINAFYPSLSPTKKKKKQDMTVPFARARAKLGGSIR